ncbi:PaREP1 family protein [Vulcanisaeta distributa]|uniref:PaREP1 family protein n=1 Tax=Vulcanisaeta distributa TaxID=164451 RepID=UPI000699997B|nr:PaREP1 family protein [Vulcanisaeta distributa]
MEQLPKPWFDLNKYREVRLREAMYETELAESFLNQGFIRNAAGKAFQAWKALVAAYAVDKISELRKLFPGIKRLGGFRVRVEKVYWIVAVMPTTVLKPVAQVVGGDIDVYTNMALWLYEYQYNGPDKQSILSPYPDDESASRDIRTLISKVRELAEKAMQ